MKDVDLTTSLVGLVNRARARRSVERLHEAPLLSGASRPTCLMLKPGVLEPGVDLRGVLQLVHTALDERDIQVSNVLAVPGPVLAATSVMSRHYGRLNREAVAPTPLPPGTRELLSERFGVDIGSLELVGGFQALQRWPDLSTGELDNIWTTSAQVTLAASRFCALTAIRDVEVLLVNGFVPRLMQRYARARSAIVVYALDSSADSQLRSDLLGHPDPIQARPSTLRRLLYDARLRLGITDICLGWNGVHMSANSAEAHEELNRFDALDARRWILRMPSRSPLRMESA